MEQNGKTHIYVTDIRQLPQTTEALASLLPPDRFQKMSSFRLQDDRLRCLAGWLLMTRFLGENLQKRFRYDHYGKPFLSDGPCFNLSHSGCYTVLAISEVPVGIDIEQQREEDCGSLARTAFHPDEQDWFFRMPTTRRFFDLWTLKESYLKLLGIGLSQEPNSFSLRHALDNRPDDTRYSARLSSDRPEMQFKLYGDTLPGYSLALCVLGSKPPPGVTAIRM